MAPARNGGRAERGGLPAGWREGLAHMAATHYSFVDLTVLPALRRRLLASEATVLFAADLGRVLWANPRGARLFGGAGIAELVGSPLSPQQPFVRQLAAAVRQIEPDEPIVRGFRLARGARSELILCELSCLALPGGEAAVLLAAMDERGAAPGREHELAAAAVEALSGFTPAAAIVDDYGLALAASPGFADIELSPEDIAAALAETAADADHLAKRVIAGADDRRHDLGIARLSERPGRHLLIGLAPATASEAEPAAAADREAEPADAADTRPAGAGQVAEAVPAAPEPPPAAGPAAVAPRMSAPAPPAAADRGTGAIERWYGGLLEPGAPLAPKRPRPAGAEMAQPEAAPAGPEKTPEPAAPLAAGEPSGEPARPAAAGEARPSAPFVFSGGAEPVRFAWLIDAEQMIRSVSPELARTVGPNAADIVGRKWREVAAVFGFDRAGEIARLLEKRDTWSGKTVLWPVEGTDLAVPVDLAALPSFRAGRTFDGFRGFGIIRCADAVVDPDETGLALAGMVPSETGTGEEVEARRLGGRHRGADDGGETGNGPGANVVELASRKRAEAREELSRRESQAFSEIGRALLAGEAGLAGPAEAGEAANREPPEEAPDGAPPALSAAGTPAPPQAAASILAQLPLPVLVYRNGETLFANAELLELTGYGSTGDIAAAGGIDALLVGGDDGRAVLATREGRRLAIDPHLQTVPWDGGKALLLSFRPPAAGDLPTDEKVALDMARVAELQNILDTATDGIVIATRDGMVESLNASAEALFGVDSVSAAARPLAELFAQESHKTLTDYMAELAEPGVASILNDGREVIGKEAKGGLIPLFVTIGRVGAAEKVCLVLRDLTQWKKAEEELVNARRAAETASEQKSEFLARVSHEIRTPLNAIIGFSDVMLEERFGPIGNERYRDYLRDINRSGVHVLDLINDLLDISKIEAGKMELTYEAVDLNQIVAETVALLQPQANRERIIIRTSLSRAVPRVVADARSIRQIILNLVSNAIKFTPENGQVIVSTVYEGSGEVALRVRDTGRGMSEAEIETAMKPFHQLRGADDRRGRGTGLGLPLTKALVEANRAYFDLESQPGEGTIAHVHFPTQRVLAD